MNHSLYIAALESFVDEGYLSKVDLVSAHSETEAEDRGQVQLKSLLLQGRIPEKAFAQTLSGLHQAPLVSAADFPTAPIAETMPLADFLKQHEVLPLSLDTDQLDLAMVDPSDDFVIRVLGSKLHCQIKPHVATRSELLMALMTLYSNKTDDAGNNVSRLANQYDAPEDIESESELVRELHRVLQRGIAMGASDIHFEPQAQALNVRYRIAGVLQKSHRFDAVETLAVLARIKLMARLDVTQRRLPQDGRFKFPADGQLLDLRVSTMPLHNGESIVIRLLDPSVSNKSLLELGYTPAATAVLQKVIERRQGLLLVTGPTGSGKSTTLYSLLNRLNQPDIKIISIENPVEIVLPGVNQIQIDVAHGLSFASALKSVLRQDPDVIMIGEIRDAETARLAAQAALTGHLVLSTLHTSSASAAVTRLRDLGLADYLISETLSTVVAQRLVRVKCSACAPDKPVASCQTCFGSGYSGRVAIAELLECTNALDLTLPTAVIEATLQDKLLEHTTLRDEASRLLKEGLIDRAEVLRVLGALALPTDQNGDVS